MEVIEVILTLAGLIVGSIIAVSPIIIMSRLAKILEEARRHNRLMEAKVDILHDLLRDIAQGPREYV